MDREKCDLIEGSGCLDLFFLLKMFLSDEAEIPNPCENV